MTLGLMMAVEQKQREEMEAKKHLELAKRGRGMCFACGKRYATYRET